MQDNPTISYVGGTTTDAVDTAGNLIYQYQTPGHYRLWPQEINSDDEEWQVDNLKQLERAIAKNKGAKVAEQKKVTHRFIRYWVIDKDKKLAEESPETCVLDSGETMVVGEDDTGFLLGLEINEKLLVHNTGRVKIEYQAGDKTKKLLPIRAGDLDVVIQVLKEYYGK